MYWPVEQLLRILFTVHLKWQSSECPEDSIVLIHDGVRPYVSYDVISNNIESVKKYGNAITSTACYETIMISENGVEIDSVPPRKDTYSAQAPQSLLPEGYHCRS